MSDIHDRRPLHSKLSAKKDRSRRENLKQPQTPESSDRISKQVEPNPLFTGMADSTAMLLPNLVSGAVKKREGQLDEPNQINQSLAPEATQAQKYTPGEYYKEHSEAKATQPREQKLTKKDRSPRPKGSLRPPSPRSDGYLSHKGLIHPKTDKPIRYIRNNQTKDLEGQLDEPNQFNQSLAPSKTRPPQPREQTYSCTRGTERPKRDPRGDDWCGNSVNNQRIIRRGTENPRPNKKRKNRSQRENLRPPSPPTPLAPPSPPTPISHEGTRYHTLFGNKPTTETTPISRLRM